MKGTKSYVPRKPIGTSIRTGGTAVKNAVKRNYPSRMKGGGSGKSSGPQTMH